MLYYRVQHLLSLPPASDGQNVWLRIGLLDKISFLFAWLLLAQPLLSFVLVDSDDDSTTGATVYNLQLLLMWSANMAVMVLETYRMQPRSSTLKSFWLADLFVRLLRFRLGLLHMYFDEPELESHTSDDRASADVWGFILSCGIVLPALFQKPAQVKVTGESYGKMRDDGEDERVAQKFEGKGEQNASWFSSFTFEWVTHVLNTGMEKQLSDEDLHPLTPDDTSTETGNNLLKEWNAELERNPDDPSLVAVSWRVYKRTFLISGDRKSVV